LPDIKANCDGRHSVTHCKRVQPVPAAYSLTLPLALSSRFASSLFPISLSLPVPHQFCFAATTSNAMSDAMSLDGVHASGEVERKQ
jgi:hypothetical protein